ncbi:deoxyguanosinetriphosphate triphosphohydrolase [Serratia quinivorans]|uniref:deoxyguanosinetriphosphate triphosphohydrolase n=1 Tax=Serratia quinivorans TaxID=137545 RepID=UPI0021792F8F|nr:deoxyguanosinetriphosphate triphosphohydrolase [Serratia quinivorans]CAI0847670.1 Deoxyguanosinetriphosphate triphosphohydrolase [Serratia quinivorans]CAI0864619.1 Deoxyguanosinetriphosphate triphosphohydrolase [Serratia quinivorans]CAI0890449.1 Deoxyguanosinetriphosphate triphosphohydrolase [Serratia quinivorans]CAI1504195.1 Deoxyguanosinetriphosphate triphosphohydrolase [Serratia quinivorans]CAI2050017.1 Deoxyguanosinetriphosphate triphosphohydrolase [Serratia quinivorans]
MQRMSWDKLLSDKRDVVFDEEPQDIRSEFFRDYDRIVFSSAFRRLARKTQVHPLSFNDHVHNRLTHSIEVSSVGRSLGYAVGLKLKSIENDLPEKFTPSTIASIIQAACVAHDIGNPPFGHAGEYAIRQWFSENSLKISNLNDKRMIHDLVNFEGNAQGFRVVSKLENHLNEGGLRLTFATLGTLIKYPWPSDHPYAIENEKFNILLSDEDVFKKLSDDLGLIYKERGEYCRHPLSYLMEAADDICYKIIDIEDAIELGILRFDDVLDCFEKITPGEHIDTYGEAVFARRRFIPLRSSAIESLINEVSRVFIENYDLIMTGEFEGDLFSKINGSVKDGINSIKSLTSKNIFSNRRKVELEVGSYSTIEILLDAFISAVNEIMDENKKVSFKSKRILELLDEPINRADGYYENYLRIVDFVSGMTDNYATYIAKQIEGSAK